MNKQQWSYEIKPSSGGISLNINEVLEYRDLIFLFVKREFVSKYKQTILGPLWAIIQPMLTTVVFTVIFGNLAKLTTADVLIADNTVIPSFLFYMIGTILWTYFSSTVAATANTFIANMHIMGKVYYPRLVTPISTALSNLIPLGIQAILFVIIAIFTHLNGQSRFVPSLLLLLLPLSIIQIVIFAIGIGIIISALTTKYRDLHMLVSFGLELWKYGTPVAYGLLLIPSNWLRLYLLNPVAVIITTVRYGIFGVGFFSWSSFFVSWIISILFFVLGVLLFNRIERTFMDTI